MKLSALICLMTQKNRNLLEDQTFTWDEYMKEFGLNLQRIRQCRRYSQERVAFDACISKVQYQRLENGGFSNDKSSNPTAKTLMALCQVLNVEINELFPKPWPDLRNR